MEHRNCILADANLLTVYAVKYFFKVEFGLTIHEDLPTYIPDTYVHLKIQVLS